MPVTDPRVIPLLSARIYYPGTAEPRVTLQQQGWYDLLEHSHGFGTISKSSGELTLEYVEGVGLCCRPSLVQKDTRTSQFATSGGAWDELRPFGGELKYWLTQYSATASQTWSATSSYFLPSDPHVAIQLLVFDTPPEHNVTTHPPAIRMEFGLDASGVAQWAIRVDQTAGWFLQRLVNGTWESVLDLGQPDPIRQLGGDRFLVLFRPMRGRICISTDFGRTYSQYRTGDATVVRVGKWKIIGQGHTAMFNLSQLLYRTGTYTSNTKNLFTDRGGQAPSFAGSRYDAPTGTSVAWADLSDDTSAQYRITVTPTSSGSTPFAIYRTPIVYATWMKFAALTGAAIPMWDDLSDVLACDVDKGSMELDESTCNLTLRKDAAVQFSWPYANRAVIDVQAGWLNEDGTTANYTIFHGYTRAPEPMQREYGKASYDITIDNASVSFKESEWTDFDTLPLGGQTLNSALDEILGTLGKASDTYRLWHVLGDFIILPTGLPENPSYWPRRGETKWETMRQMCEDWGLELGVLDDGRYATIPKNFADLFISQTWEGAPSSDATNAVHALRVGFDSSEQATCIIVQGVDENGATVYGFAVDTLAEGVPASPHFYPWRKVIQEEIPGTATVGMCVARAQGLAYEHFRLKVEGDIEVPWKPGIGRRAAVQVTGTNVGLSDLDILFALTARHTIRPAIADCKSYFGLRRKNL